MSGTGLCFVRVIGAALVAALLCAALPGAVALGDELSDRSAMPALTSPLAQDIDRQLARDVEHQLNLEQSRVLSRSATTPLQRGQTRRDIQTTRQNLETLKTRVPQAKPIPVLERKLDRVSRPTGALTRSPGLESGFSTSLGLSGSVGGR
jgi:hypothetical protein